MTSDQTRSMHLLDGRRVTIADLVEAGRLDPGDEIVFKRPRLGKTHRASITPEGAIVIDGGEEFNSPSRAAAAAASMKAVDGWHAWTDKKSGRTLDYLRQQLLSQTVTEGASPTQGRYEWLKELRSQADTGRPDAMPVRELLLHWDAKADGTSPHDRVEADLANHGLTTLPSYRKVTLDTSVQLVTVEQEVEAIGRTTAEPGDDGGLDAGLTVGNLPTALGGVQPISPSATIAEAITLMRLNGYSQLPVLSGERNLRGAVTWESIANALHANTNAKLTHAIVPAAEARYDDELVKVLPTLEEQGFVFVRDQTEAVAGIVTTTDVVVKYRELSTPFILIGELDQVLRQLIARTFSLDQVRSLCDADGRRAVKSFDDLEMGDYQRVLENRECWERLGWRIDRRTLIKRLDDLRMIRNNVMHFNPEPLPAQTVEWLRLTLKLLRDLGTQPTA